MKNLFKPLFALAFMAVTLTSCMSNDNNNDSQIEEMKKNQTRVDELLTKQKSEIEKYANEVFATPVEDKVEIDLEYINKKVKRGIWYYVEAPGEADSYKYSVNSSGTALVYPKLKLKYTAKLLDGTVVQEDVTGGDYNLGISQSNVFNNAWYYSFFPHTIKFNNQDIKVLGLTEKGLQKGSIFHMVTPSVWAFDAQTVTHNGKTIPANSPLVYRFEVLSISE